MSFLKILTSIFLIIGVSGSVFDDESDLYSSKTEAFEQCEEWKDEGNVVVYPIHVNIAEEASRFNLEHPAPLLISPSSTMGKLKYADRVYEWNQLVKNFLDNYLPIAQRDFFHLFLEAGDHSLRTPDWIWGAPCAASMLRRAPVAAGPP